MTFAKELIRLVFVERTVRGTSNLFRGLRDGGRIGRERAGVRCLLWRTE